MRKTRWAGITAASMLTVALSGTAWAQVQGSTIAEKPPTTVHQDAHKHKEDGKKGEEHRRIHELMKQAAKESPTLQQQQEQWKTMGKQIHDKQKTIHDLAKKTRKSRETDKWKAAKEIRDRMKPIRDQMRSLNEQEKTLLKTWDKQKQAKDLQGAAATLKRLEAVGAAKLALQKQIPVFLDQIEKVLQ